MKVEAYRCDRCGRLVDSESAIGVSASEDMFDRKASYPLIWNPDKAVIHVCTDCMRDHAMVPAQNQIDRRKDEHLYKLKVQELSYDVRFQAVRNAWTRGKKKL